MILVLFLCVIIMLLMIAIIFTLLSTIKIDIKNFEATNKQHIKQNYEVAISLNILNKLKWISFRLNAKKMKKLVIKMHLEKIDIKKLERDLQLSDIQEIFRIRAKISSLNLNIKIGLEDAVITSYIVPIICTVISLILPHITEKKNISNIKYKVEPVYNQNAYHIKLNTVLEIKLINVLNSAYRIYKSRKSSSEKSKANKMVATNS